MRKLIDKDTIKKIRYLYNECNLTQVQVAQMLGLRQSAVSYHSSSACSNRAREYSRARNKIIKCGGRGLKFIVYKELGTLKMTDEENYSAMIQDAHKITKLHDFESFDEVVSYFQKYYKMSKDDFIDRTGGNI